MVVGTDIESLARGIGESRQSVRFRTPDTVTQAAHSPKRRNNSHVLHHIDLADPDFIIARDGRIAAVHLFFDKL